MPTAATTKGMRSLCFPHTRAPSPPTTSAAVSNTPPPPESATAALSIIDETIEAAHSLITKWNPSSSSYASVTSLFYESRREAKHFLACVAELQKAMHFLLTAPSHDGSSSTSSSDRLVRAHCLMQIAMKRLQKEFYQILCSNRAYLDPESLSTRSSRVSAARYSSSDFENNDDDDDVSTEDDEARETGDAITEAEEASERAMEDLRQIAESMICAGYGKECVHLYTSIRKSIVDEGVYRLGVDKTMSSSSRIHKADWEVVELKIKAWLDAVKIAVKTLFTGERILCDHVFAASDAIRESCFSEICKEGATTLFRFPELVAKRKQQTPDRVFRLLDLYSGLSDQWPEIQSIFSFDSTAAVQSQAFASLAGLSEAVYKTVMDFESTIHRDSAWAKSPVAGGGVHPLTVYAMNHLSLLSDYGGFLTDIVADWPLPEYDTGEAYSGDMPAISRLLSWLVLVLLCRIDCKAKQYKDISVTYLFLANNLNHVASIVRASGLRSLLGEELTGGYEEKVQQFAENYEQLGWGHVFDSLPENPTAGMSTGEAKECFRRFNDAFEAAYLKQSTSVVPDSKLRDEIKQSIARKIVTPYREMCETHMVTLGCKRNVECLVRYTPEDVQNSLSDLFGGGGVVTDDSACTASSCSSSSLHPRHSRHREGKGIFA